MAGLASFLVALAVLVGMWPLVQSRTYHGALRSRRSTVSHWGQESWHVRLARRMGAEEADRLCQYAGRPYGLTGLALLQYQFLFALLCVILFGTVSLFFAIAGGFFSWFMPRILLSSMAQQRRMQIALELPAFLDLWGLLVAAGEGVETALVEICRRHPEWQLSTEMRRALERISASGLFGESLVEEARVTGSPEFVMVADQVRHLADGGGIPSKELGRMAEQMREQRMAELSQSAGAMAVMGIFPKLGAVFLSLAPVIASIILSVVKSV